MAPHLGDGDWQSIAEQASKEMDSAKLTILIEKLCRALESKPEGRLSLQRQSTGNEPGSFPSD